MLTAGNALAKTLVKSQKITFWSQKNSFTCFFWLTAKDALSKQNQTTAHYVSLLYVSIQLINLINYLC